MISIVVLTHDRLPLLRNCVENVLLRTSEATQEIVIWDNACRDGTAEYLDSLIDPRIRVVHSPRNIGQNAYAEAFARTTQPYLIELDDDVTEAPMRWDEALLDAFRKLPNIGFLAASLLDDPNDPASQRLHRGGGEYAMLVENGVRLLKGPTGGGCAITSRELHDRVGGFRRKTGKVFWLEDEAYIRDIARLGYGAAYLADLEVHHTGGPYYAPFTADKQRYWDDLEREIRRKELVKRTLYRLPLVPRLNERHGWFQPPAAHSTRVDG